MRRTFWSVKPGVVLVILAFAAAYDGSFIKLTGSGTFGPGQAATMSSALAQESRRAFSLEDIGYLLKQNVAPVRVAELVEERGVTFELTDETRSKLKKAGKERAEKEAWRRAEREQPKVMKGKDGAEMVRVPAGEFWMGCNEDVDKECDGDEKPGRRVYLDEFYIDKYEVTNSRYRSFIEATDRDGPLFWDNSKYNGSRKPVVGVRWHDAKAYCEWEGKRLPTEAEWEKAARGTDGRRYPWGNQWDSNRANTSGNGTFRPVSVGSYSAGVSPYGVHDMAGNVWEWVADWWGSDYYQQGSGRNPKGPSSGNLRVVRGSSWTHTPWAARASNRRPDGPDDRINDKGFRCVR